MVDYLADKGLRVWANGYNVIPITPNKKRPSVTGWENLPTTETRLKGWISNGRASHGIGITTGEVTALDFDISVKSMADRMIDYVTTHINFPVIRIGNAPKALLLFRTETPFRKISSKIYTDPEGRRAQVEILGEGQQFVAFAIHEDTGKPYRWIGAENPEVTPASELPVITEAQCRAAITYFEEQAELEGWQRRRSPGAVATIHQTAEVPGFVDPDDIHPDGSEPCGLSEIEINRNVMLIPNDEAFDAREDWLKIGFAIHHETDGSEFGRDLWNEWSIQHPSHDQALFDKAWNSFGKRDSRFRGVTFRYIIKLASEYKQIELGEQVKTFIKQLESVLSVDELRPICAEIRKTEFDDLHQASIVATLKTVFKRFTGQILGIKEARDMIKFKPAELATPDWLENWCYLKHIDRYFNVKTKEMLGKVSFDSAFGRNLPPDGTVLPSYFALNWVKIPVYHMRYYLPTADEVFTMDGQECVNLYSDRHAAVVPTSLTARDRENVERVQRHFQHLFTDVRDRRILASWLAYIVQTKKRSNWAVVIQGTEGDGKTFFAYMMAAILGSGNVYTLNTESLNRPHNDWAEGHLLTCIEEIRLIGHNRYDILNRIKPNITNETIEIHAKYLSAYNILNTSSYLALTNHRDALPLDDNDSRYFILMSRWQDAVELNAFKKNHPDYYDKLYGAVGESAGAIRLWLEHYHLDPEFNSRERAPDSHGRQQMIAIHRSDETEILAEIIAEGKHQDISNDLVIVSSMIDEFNQQIPGRPLWSGNAVRRFMSSEGFSWLGRVVIDGEKQSIWTRVPRRWSPELTTRNFQIKKWLEGSL